MNDHILLRKKIKAKKPTFLRQDSHKNKKLAKVWRRPKGKTNKVRLRIRGYVRLLETGYGSPRDVKGTSPSGKQIRYVSTMSDIAKLNPKTDDVIISKTVGARKKLALIDALKKNKIDIINFDADAFTKQVQERIAAAQQKKEEKKQDKKEKKEEKKEDKAEDKKKKETQEDKATAEDPDDKKKKEKEEKDKLLTKRE